MSDRDVNLTQCGTRNGKDTFGLDARSRDISCDHGMPCEKPTRHSLALEASPPLAMVRSDKVHIVAMILSGVLWRNPFSNVRLLRHTTVRDDLFCSVPAEVVFEMRAKGEQSHSRESLIVKWFRWQKHELNT